MTMVTGLWFVAATLLSALYGSFVIIVVERNGTRVSLLWLTSGLFCIACVVKAAKDLARSKFARLSLSVHDNSNGNERSSKNLHSSVWQSLLAPCRC